MSDRSAAPVTLGQRLDREARVLLARRTEALRQIGDRGRPMRAWDPPGNRRLRVEVDVPPAWVDDPPGMGGFDSASGSVRSPGVPFPAGLRERLRPVVGPGLDRIVLHDGEMDPAADALTRRQHAAAMTVGEEVFLRWGRFRPDLPEGRGLLAHEAWHAVQATRPGTAWRRATAGGRAAEERAAAALGAAVSTEPALVGRAPRRAVADESVSPGRAGQLSAVTAERILAGAGGPAEVRLGGTAGPPDDGWPGGPVPQLTGPPGAGPRRARPGSAATLESLVTGTQSQASGSPAMTPMAAPDAGAVDGSPPPASGPDPATTRDALLRELMRQVRTDRERGA